MARALVNEWICCFGVPDAIHSDQGSNLWVTSSLKLVAKLLGIEKTRMTPYHPQSDGFVEWMNQTLRLSYQAQKEERWDEFFPELLMAYPTSAHDTAKFTYMFEREKNPDLVQEHTEYAWEFYKLARRMPLHW